jgi:hypothetical protein
MTEGFNGDKWFLHFLDDTTGMNFVYTFPTKSFLTATIQQFTTSIRRRFGFEIKILHSDNERTLGKRFDTWIKQEGDTFESSTPYTPEQNGAAEGSGGITSTRAPVIRISANPPENVWPEIEQSYLFGAEMCTGHNSTLSCTSISTASSE